MMMAMMTTTAESKLVGIRGRKRARSEEKTTVIIDELIERSGGRNTIAGFCKDMIRECDNIMVELKAQTRSEVDVFLCIVRERMDQDDWMTSLATRLVSSNCYSVDAFGKISNGLKTIEDMLRNMNSELTGTIFYDTLKAIPENIRQRFVYAGVKALRLCSKQRFDNIVLQKHLQMIPSPIFGTLSALRDMCNEKLVADTAPVPYFFSGSDLLCNYNWSAIDVINEWSGMKKQPVAGLSNVETQLPGGMKWLRCPISLGLVGDIVAFGGPSCNILMKMASDDDLCLYQQYSGHKYRNVAEKTEIKIDQVVNRAALVLIDPVSLLLRIGIPNGVISSIILPYLMSCTEFGQLRMYIDDLVL